ncbi:MAG: LuxR C-terminal-related transcriptional regulator [Acetatifactor sp.]
MGRCSCPFWLVPVSVRQYPFVVIQEEDLRFSLNETEKYLDIYGIELDKETVRRIFEDSAGHPLFLKIVVTQLLTHGKDTRKKAYVYDDEIYRQSQQILWDYVDKEVYDQWEPELADFVLQLCVVDRFNIRMAEEVSGKSNVEEVLRRVFYTGNFLTEKDGEYAFITPMLMSMRRRLKIKYTREQRNKLYYNAGRCYMQEGKVKDALAMFEACNDKEQIRTILIENARTNPGSGYLFELRKYYLELPEDYIRDSVELVTGMCMLQSLLLNPEESERWYETLKQKEQEATGRLRQIIKSNLAYLDISLPHRGSSDVLSVLKSAWTLMKNREITLPELSVTSNAPSMMNGGKDFCEWSRRDKELAASVGKMVSFVLGKYGAGLVELALAESFFEKGEDNYEVIRLVSKGQIQAENRGKLEQCFVAAGLLCNVHILSGHTEDAKILLSEFMEKAKGENADKLLPNIYNLFARISLYRGEKAEIEEWMKAAPGEMEDFNPFERYRYLTKVRVYLLYGKYELAEGLLEKMTFYAEIMHRTYIRMECRLLLAILQYRRGYAGWGETFQQAYTDLEDYHFVRLISREGGAVLPLLKAEQWAVKDKRFMAQVMKETSAMAEYYPAYLKEQLPGEDSFSENAIRILRMQAEGMSNEQIAEQMEITTATVKYHCRQTYKKLGVNGKAAAVMEARKRKLI